MVVLFTARYAVKQTLTLWACVWSCARVWFSLLLFFVAYLHKWEYLGVVGERGRPTAVFVGWPQAGFVQHICRWTK